MSVRKHTHDDDDDMLVTINDDADTNADEDDVLGIIDDDDDNTDTDDELAMTPEEREAKEKKDKKRNIVLYVVIGVVIAALIGAMGWALYASSHKDTVKKQGSSVSNTLSSGNKNGDTSVASDTSSPADKLMKQMGVPEFYRKPEPTLTQEEKAEAKDYAMANADANAYAAFSMSSSINSDSGFANDDGSINMDYSYLNANNVIPTIQNDIQRLINPVYGQWTAMQSGFYDGSGIDINGNEVEVPWLTLVDMFSSTIPMNNEDEVHSAMNVYADWDNNLYNNKYLGRSADTPIVGSVQSQNCNYAIQGVDTDSITCTVKVRYETYLQNAKDPIITDKTMTLHYKINYDEQESSDRVILLTKVEQD